ncbi:MerR family transcriptional regulator [Streptomyces marispadix]|uniref:MerR family transcriptional regulator n=1 Tax=Streptomyces marispadix TaxID=2922868 RepID=A0ABS9T3V7_9ACTN|nr:MerR family transcriptional regulator [Streptomyces marispadix]MCH6163192.1 MerR family transcriptional regulator [Streptomyces marispadix]
MLSISDFSSICQLPPQTLRYYHSEGLLVPAEVDEATGYRTYNFDQVEQAMLVTVLRGSGLSVKDVRRVLDEPDTATALLQQHSVEVRRRREIQDNALGDARVLLAAWPEPRIRQVPGMTVVSKVVPGPETGARDYYDWDYADTALAATLEEVIETVESCGAVVSGSPWRSPAAETEEQMKQQVTAEGPHWLVKVPVTADEKALAALHGDVEVQSFQAREELSIVLPGRSSNAKYATAISRLVQYPAQHDLGGRMVEITAVRQVLHEDSVETAMALVAFDES